MTNRSREDMLRFLDYLADKGLVPAATASSRKIAATKVLSILSEDEASDVTGLNLDAVMKRFQNLNAQTYSPGSLQTYKSRMRTSLDDFSSYCDNPLSFKPSGQAKPKTKPIITKFKGGTAAASNIGVADQVSPTAPMPNINVLPIAVRAGLTVQVAGLPFDLTKGEAQKIANIILAHANAD